LSVGGLFAGESMFHGPLHEDRDASKVALVGLVELLLAAGDAADRLLDVQWATEHLVSLGTVEVPRPDYLALLGRALELPDPFAVTEGSR
jgi:leucyl/phenylalanyl-tRNA--protein transferase